MTTPKPTDLESVDPTSRTFPSSWKDAAIRALFDDVEGGVLCVGCNQYKRGRRELRGLHGDHIMPWSRGGLSTWENFQLLCGSCNLDKSNNI